MKKTLFFCFIMLIFISACTSSLPKPTNQQLKEIGQLVTQKKYLEVDELLNNYGKTPKTQLIRGDILAYQKDWEQVPQYFQEALQLLEKENNIYSYEEFEERKAIYDLLADAQLLAGEMLKPIEPPPRDPSRSLPFDKEILLPVEFDENGWKVSDITSEGKKNVRELAYYLEEHSVKKVILVAHTDKRGDAVYNQRLSERRAISIKKYLLNIIGNSHRQQLEIEAIGRGEDEPLRPLPRWKNLTQEEIYQRDRRVECQFID